MAISALPEAPEVTDTATQFDNLAFPWVAALNTFGTEANALATAVNEDAVAAAASEAAAAVSEAAAESSALTAEAAANFAGAWSSLTGALNKPAQVYHVNQLWTLLNNLAAVETSEPGVTADWLRVTQAANIRVTAVDVTAAAGDHVVFTAATKTVTLPAAPLPGDHVWISVGAFVDTVIDRNALNIMSTADDLTIDRQNVTIGLRYVDSTRGWVLA
jgi:hypothetical protein